MDTNVLPQSAAGLVRLPVVMAELDIGAELDWQPEHQAESAWHEHVPFAYWLVKALRPRSIVELGTHWGVSYAAFCQAVDRFGLDARCFAVDTWEGDTHAGEYGNDVFGLVSGLNDARWRRFSTLLRSRFDEARRYFGPGELDLLHIDGFHTYEAVAGDFATWRETLSDRGVVLFHDTNVLEREFGVRQLWQELKAQHPHFEFVHGHGLGVLGLGRDFPPAIAALFAAGADAGRTAALRALFSARGEAVRTRFLQARAATSLAQTSQRLAMVEQEAATLRATTGTLHHEAEALRDRVAASTASIEAMRQDLARYEASKRAPDEAALQVLQAERDRLASDHAAACRARDHAAATAAQALAAAAAAEARRDALIASSSWRITRPLRVATGLLRGEPGYRARLRQVLGGRASAGSPPAPDRQHGSTDQLALAAPPPTEAVAMPGGAGLPILPGGATPAGTLIARSLPSRMVSFPDPGNPRRLTMVTDSISAGSLFGGVGTAAILAALLAKRQDMALRIVTRRSPPEPRNFGTILAAQGIRYDGNIEFLHSGTEGEGHALPMGDNDLLLTTSWWTTSAARNIAPAQRILYLLQEDERMFYPAGDEQLRCQEVMQDESLRFVINTRALHDHLVQQGMRGVIANGMAFEPAFPDSIYHAADRPEAPPAGGRRRFFFYARPHHSRNLFLHGLEAVNAAIERGVLRAEDWEFHFVGANLPPVMLPGNIRPQLAQNLPWTEYAALVRSIDVGLSLMQTPHPSYPPLDLAASGAVVVTNRCGPKVSLEQYSRNILCVEPTVEGLVQGLAEAVALAADAPRRQANYAAGRINRDWEAAFAPVLDRLAAA